MHWHEKHSQRTRSLQRGEALNVSSTDEEGRNIRKVKISERSRSLVEVPGHPGHVVNIEKEKDGLTNFLRLQGHTKRDTEKILKEVERTRTVTSPRRYRSEDRGHASCRYGSMVPPPEEGGNYTVDICEECASGYSKSGEQVSSGRYLCSKK